MKTPPLAVKPEDVSAPAADREIKASKPAANRNSGRFSQWRQREMHLRFSAHYEAYRKNPQARLWNCKSLAAELGCGEKAIGKDLATMKESLGYPLQFFPAKHGWMYTEPFTPVLAPSITKSELASISIAFRAIEALKESPIFAPVLDDIEKLISTLTEHLGSDFAAVASCITFKTTGIDSQIDPAIFETLISAICNHEELEVAYSKLNQTETNGRNGSLSGTPAEPSDSNTHPHPTTVPHPAAPWLRLPVEARKVYPLHILCQDNVWYLWLWDPMRKDERRFTLSRIRSISRTGDAFKPRKFNIERALADRIGITSGDPVDVRIQFRRKASYLVVERPWHSSQRLAPGPDAEWNLEVTLRVAHTPELERWLFSYDEDFRVIEPTTLKAAVLRKSRGMAANHSEG